MTPNYDKTLSNKFLIRSETQQDIMRMFCNYRRKDAMKTASYMNNKGAGPGELWGVNAIWFSTSHYDGMLMVDDL